MSSRPAFACARSVPYHLVKSLQLIWRLGAVALLLTWIDFNPNIDK